MGRYYGIKAGIIVARFDNKASSNASAATEGVMRRPSSKHLSFATREAAVKPKLRGGSAGCA